MTRFATYKGWDKSPQDLLDALHSGRYKQLTGTLCGLEYNDETDEDIPTGAYCCLGVYEDITSDHWSAVNRSDGSFDEIIPTFDYHEGTSHGGVHWLRIEIETWSGDLGTQRVDLENLLIRANDAGITDPPFQRPIRVLEQFIEGKRSWDQDDLRVLGIP